MRDNLFPSTSSSGRPGAREAATLRCLDCRLRAAARELEGLDLEAVVLELPSGPLREAALAGLALVRLQGRPVR